MGSHILFIPHLVQRKTQKLNVKYLFVLFLTITFYYLLVCSLHCVMSQTFNLIKEDSNIENHGPKL